MAVANPLARAMLEVNALPSRFAHPAQLEAWAGVTGGARAATSDAGNAPDAMEGVLPRLIAALTRLSAHTAVSGEAIFHRHVSAALLRDPALDLGWIESPDEPALALCAAPPALFESLQRSAGLMLLGPGIRQVIARSEMAAIEQQLGPESMDFIRRVAPRLWIGGAVDRVDAAQVSRQALAWGGELLARAWAMAAPPVARRGRLRLPPGADAADTGAGADAQARPGAARLPAPRQALALALAILKELDAAWLSHFPAPR